MCYGVLCAANLVFVRVTLFLCCVCVEGEERVPDAVMCGEDMRRLGRGGDVLVVVVELTLLLLLQSLVPAAASGACVPSCVCSTTGSTTAVSCHAVGRVPVALPQSTVTLDLDHNHISLLTNASFSRALPLRRLQVNNHRHHRIETFIVA